MAITRLGPNQSVNLASNVTGTLPAANVANSTLNNVTALPAAITTGKVLQVANDMDGGHIVLNNTDWIDTALSISFTPVSASSKILMLATVQRYSDGGSASYHGEFQARFHFNGSAVNETYADLTLNANPGAIDLYNSYINQENSPGTSAFTIKVQVRNPNTNQAYCTYNQYSGSSSLTIWEYAS
jgi:hypothetical protein